MYVGFLCIDCFKYHILYHSLLYCIILATVRPINKHRPKVNSSQPLASDKNVYVTYKSFNFEIIN